jgi:hypothetical protein
MAYDARYYINALSLDEPWYEPNWEVLAEDQAGIVQAKAPTHYGGPDGAGSDGGVGGNTTRMD